MYRPHRSVLLLPARPRAAIPLSCPPSEKWRLATLLRSVAVSPPKCRYRRQGPYESRKEQKSHHPPCPLNNLVSATKILKTANEIAAHSSLCRIYLLRSRLRDETKERLSSAVEKVVVLTVNPAATCSKMSQLRCGRLRMEKTPTLEVQRMPELMEMRAE